MPQPEIRLPYNQFILRLELERNEPVSRFLSATVRGGFGYALRSIACVTHRRTCEGCILKDTCAYARIFEPGPPPADAPRLRKVSNIPRPFVMRTSQAGKDLAVELTLIGHTTQYLPYFIYTFDTLGRRGLGRRRLPFEVGEVTTREGEQVYNSAEKTVAGHVTPHTLVLGAGRPEQGRAGLTFRSPLVLRKDGRILSRFDRRTFVATALRRVTNLNAFFGEHRTVEIDPSPWLHAADGLRCEDGTKRAARARYSTRQKKRIDYSGLVGTVTLSGDIGTLMPLLRIGEIVGVGKNTVFGFGCYTVAAETQGEVEKMETGDRRMRR